MESQDDHTSHDKTDRGGIEKLLQAAQDGCAESRGQLLDLCRKYLLSIANRDLESGLRPKVAASDVVQETLIEAQRDLSDFDGHSEQELLAWLRRILQNNLIDNRRRFFQTDKRQLNREQPLASGDDHGIAEPTTTSSILARDEDAERMRSAVAVLPDDYRRVIELRNWQLKSFEDIGVELDRSAEAARKLWGRAIAHLQQQMKGDHRDRPEPNA